MNKKIGLTVLLTAMLWSCNSLRFSRHVTTQIDWAEKDSLVVRNLKILPVEDFAVYEERLREALRFSLFKIGKPLILAYQMPSPVNQVQPEIIDSRQSRVVSTPPRNTANSFSDFLDEYSGLPKNKTEPKSKKSNLPDKSSGLPENKTKPESENLPSNSTLPASEVAITTYGKNAVIGDIFLIANRWDDPRELKSYYTVSAGIILYDAGSETGAENETPGYYRIFAEGHVYSKEKKFIDFSYIQKITDALILNLAEVSQVGYED